MGAYSTNNLHQAYGSKKICDGKKRQIKLKKCYYIQQKSTKHRKTMWVPYTLLRECAAFKLSFLVLIEYLVDNWCLVRTFGEINSMK